VERDRPCIFSAVVFNAEQISGLAKIEARPTDAEKIAEGRWAGASR
jgi:antirestriction protein ArdC